MSEKHKCCGRVSPPDAWRSYQCGKNASMEHEGKHYCKTHHPPTVRAKRDASQAKWEADWRARRSREEAAARAAAEQKRKAEAYDQLVGQRDDLLAALRKMIEMNQQWARDQWGDENKAESMACVREARAAIAKCGVPP